MYPYESHASAGAQREETEEKTGRSSEAHVDAGALRASLGTGTQNSREVVRKYLQEKKGTLVIRLVVAAFERENAIVHIDLINRLAERNPASAKAAATQRTGRHNSRGILLRNSETFVLVKVHFREVGRDDAFVVRMAPYGDPESSAHGPQIRIRCATECLLDKTATGFRARCLGEVQEWNAQEGVLDIEPMAVFRYQRAVLPRSGGTVPGRSDGGSVPACGRRGRRMPDQAMASRREASRQLMPNQAAFTLSDEC